MLQRDRPASDRILLALQRTLTTAQPLDALRALGELRAELDAFEHEQVRRALDQGVTFAAVGRALGISRQAAHRRYRAPAQSRTVVSAQVRGVLQAARQEAARAGAAEIECEHAVLALAAGGRIPARRVSLDAARVLVATPRAGGAPPTRLGRRLRALLTSLGAPVDVDALQRALPADPVARRILERLEA